MAVNSLILSCGMPQGVQQVLDATQTIKDSFANLKNVELSLDNFLEGGALQVLKQEVNNALGAVTDVLGEANSQPPLTLLEEMTKQMDFLKKTQGADSLIDSIWKPFVGTQSYLLADKFGQDWIDKGLAEDMDEVRDILYQTLRDFNNGALDPNVLCQYGDYFNISIDPLTNAVQQLPMPLEPQTTAKIQEFASAGEVEPNSTYQTIFKNDNKVLNGATEVIKALDFENKTFRTNQVGGNRDVFGQQKITTLAIIRQYLDSIGSSDSVETFVANNPPAKLRLILEPYIKGLD